MNRYVLKYGGKSIATIDKIKSIAAYIIERKNKGDSLIIVLSAMADNTNALLALANEVAIIPNRRDLDLLLATGEVISISLMSILLNELGYSAIALMGFQAGIITSGEHTKSEIVDIDIKKIESYLDNNKTVIVAGFQGINKAGDITTLGRGGSDTTAVALAAKLKCPCEIYTDVDGIYKVDPKEYKHAKKIDKISYRDMKTFAYLGAKVMAPRSIEIGEQYNVEIRVGNMNGEGTYITSKDIENQEITGIAINEKLLYVRLKLNDVNQYIIINELINEKINVDQINYSKKQITFIIDSNDLVLIEKIISKYPNVKKYSDEIIRISLVGKMIRSNKVILEVLNVLNDNNVLYHEIKLLESSLSIITSRKLKSQVVELLAKHFNL